MADPRQDDALAFVPTLTATVLGVAVLYFAQEVLIPIALSVLLSFVLTRLVIWLERWRLGRVPSVLLAVALAFAVLGGIGWMVTDQLIDLARDLPKYQDALAARIRSLRSVPIGGGVLGGITESARELGEELSGLGSSSILPSTPLGTAPAGEPVPVQLVETSPLALRLLRDWVGPILAPFGTAALVIIFVIFILLSREDLRNRLIRLAGTGRVYVTTQALDEAGGRISRYLLMQLIINATYGVAVATGLFFIGIPSAMLWGLLAAVLRFLPYVGPWIAALLPIALSLAASTTWSVPIATVALFLVLELLSNNVMEPWLYGASTGLSTVGIIASAVFWTWLWGPLGLVLSTPLTVCLAVLGRHVPSAAFLDVLFSDEPPLELNLRFYQRLLALDYNEASDLTTQFLKTGSLDELYETMLIPALSLAERDRHAGHVSDEQAEFIYRSITDLLEDLKAQFETSAVGQAVPAGAAQATGIVGVGLELRPDAPRALRILCVPAEDEADRIAGAMFVQLLTARGHAAEAAPVRAIDPAVVELVKQQRAEWVVISGLAPGGAMQARRASRRLGPQATGTRILVGLWNASGELGGIRERALSAGAEAVVTKLGEGLEHLQKAAREVSRPAE